LQLLIIAAQQTAQTHTHTHTRRKQQTAKTLREMRDIVEMESPWLCLHPCMHKHKQRVDATHSTPEQCETFVPTDSPSTKTEAKGGQPNHAAHRAAPWPLHDIGNAQY